MSDNMLAMQKYSVYVYSVFWFAMHIYMPTASNNRYNTIVNMLAHLLKHTHTHDNHKAAIVGTVWRAVLMFLLRKVSGAWFVSRLHVCKLNVQIES